MLQMIFSVATNCHFMTATDDAWCVEALSTAIKALDWKQARQDVQRFVKPRELPSLELWTRDYFLQQCRKIGSRA
jgi:hypothetical protein